MKTLNTGVIVFKNIREGFCFEGLGYLDTQLTFISQGEYILEIKYYYEDEEKVLTLKGKNISRVVLNMDRFVITKVRSDNQIKLVVNNIKDYFFDLLSEN
ncbi:MAG: hypothetical protein N2Z81_03820 [Hydrogenothermaceae bacterium]|nr:hypothetical protein [Hydrogenothermaceae bacterium]